MTKVHRRKRIFYLPGLISLLGLPLVLWHFYGIQHKKTNQRTMSVFWASDSFWQLGWTPKTTWDSIRGFHPNHKMEVITLTGNEADNQVKLNYFQIRMREIIASNDSVNGLQIHFTPSTSYNSLVKTFNICKIEDAKIYWPYKDKLYFWHEPLIKKEEILNPAVVLCGGSITEYIDERTKWEKLYDKLEPIVIEFWHILTGFLILCILGFVYVKQMFSQIILASHDGANKS